MRETNECVEKPATDMLKREIETKVQGIDGSVAVGADACCTVFGYFTSYSQGPVRSLCTTYLGMSAWLHEAEVLMRNAAYHYEFFVIEYPHSNGTLSRHYDQQGNLKFTTHRGR